MADNKALIDQLGALSVLEMSELVKQLEETWGVSAAARPNTMVSFGE